MNTRPEASEHNPYFGRYISLVPDGDIVQILAAEHESTLAVLENISEEKSLSRYAPGKWSIRECYVHLTDAERIFTYRALRFARADPTPLPGFTQDDWVGPSAADARSWRSIIDEYRAVRASTLAFFKNLPEEAWTRTGSASGHPISVRAIAFITAGHDIHHRNILRNNYGIA